MGILKKITDEYFGDFEREEDKFVTNIADMKEIDLGDDFPVVFADRDLVVNGIEYFNFKETVEMYEKIKETGWRMPDYYTFDRMFYGSTRPWIGKKSIRGSFKQYDGVKIYSMKTGETLVFNTDKKYGESYWCEPEVSELKYGMERGFNAGDTSFPLYVKTNNFGEKECLKIRLVKYKETK